MPEKFTQGMGITELANSIPAEYFLEAQNNPELFLNPQHARRRLLEHLMRVEEQANAKAAEIPNLVSLPPPEDVAVGVTGPTLYAQPINQQMQFSAQAPFDSPLLDFELPRVYTRPSNEEDTPFSKKWTGKY